MKKYKKQNPKKMWTEIIYELNFKESPVSFTSELKI